MPKRFAFLLLVLALLWSGVTTHEQAEAFSRAAEAPATAAIAAAPADGSLEGLALDGLPAPAHLEQPSDAPAVPAAPGDAAAPALTMARPLPARVAALTAPYLDGPQRPPCSASFTA